MSELDTNTPDLELTESVDEWRLFLLYLIGDSSVSSCITFRRLETFFSLGIYIGLLESTLLSDRVSKAYFLPLSATRAACSLSFWRYSWM